MKKKLFIAVGIIVILLVGLLLYSSVDVEEEEVIEAISKKENLEIIVNTTGELQAENSVKIRGPSELRSIRVYNVKISDLIAEGTVVDSGAYVATLERSEVVNKLKDVELEIEKVENQLNNTRLDTTLELRNLRDQLINKKFEMEEMNITLEQSKFEPPATIRQAEISLERAKRSYDQAVKNYKLKKRQAIAKVREININLSQQTKKKSKFDEVLNKFVVKAPQPGMVIYHKEWNGSKRKVGSTINPWDPVVATLPDLTKLISKTYINEIDISKIKKKQKVEIGVDAFPEKKYTGEVIDIANIGEQLPNTDAKVFEVTIRVNESDSILRPSMTTSNKIKIAKYENVVTVPLEAIYVQDSISYVFKKERFSYKKQVVITGKANENNIIIKKGIKENETVFLTKPENAADLELEGKGLLLGEYKDD